MVMVLSPASAASGGDRVPQTSPYSGWVPFLVDRATASFSYHLPWPGGDTSASSSSLWASEEELNKWFHALHPNQHTTTDESSRAWTDAYYKGEKLLRQTAWCTLQEGCECDYGYSDTWQQRVLRSPKFHATVEEITEKIRSATGCIEINSCNLNYYPQGGGVGFHADDEFLFDGTRRETCIISLSLCSNNGGKSGARNFMVKKQQGRSEEQAASGSNDETVHQVILRHGDIITMEGMFQKDYFHSVWPGDSQDFLEDPLTQGERINLTWRTIVQHLDGSEECRGKICPLANSSTV